MIYYTLVEPAKANGIEPFAYMNYLITNIASATSVENYEKLLTWNLDPKLVK